MHVHRMMTGLICVTALLALCMMGGCPQQAEDAGDVSEPIIDPAAPQPDDGAGVDAGPAMDVTMAEVISKWPSSFVMTQTMTDRETDSETVMTSAMKMGEERPARIKTEIEEGTGIIDFDEGAMYVWQTGSDVVMKMNLPEDFENPYEDVDTETTIVGEDLVDGVECWVTETTTDEKVVRTWWGKDDGLVRRVETDEMVGTFEYEQIGSVPDSEFELPAGATVQEMDLPQMPR